MASLDQISAGRFLFGIGAGWNLEEMVNHGTDPARRFGIMRERVKTMKAIWTEEEASYHGEHVAFDAIWAWPKPVQQPHPPVLVGGTGSKVLDRVLAYGDEWFPNRQHDLEARIAELQRRAGEAGRAQIPVTLFGAEPEREAIERYTAAGVTRCLFRLPSSSADAVTSLVDELGELVAPLSGEGR